MNEEINIVKKYLIEQLLDPSCPGCGLRFKINPKCFCTPCKFPCKKCIGMGIMPVPFSELIK